MTQVFVSYSRKDSDFVRRLAAALSDRGKDPWVDWEDIPPSAKWRAAIATNIESAGVFVFVLSPDSIASEVCAWELEHALRNNKRLIPVVCREVEGAIDAALRELNWIFCVASEQFDPAMDLLISAIDTDFAWLEMHTRLLVRAREWERSANDAGFLLRGLDLEQALKWRLDEAGKKPPPADLHSRYILASQDAQAEEERRWKALYEKAEQQRRRASSRALAAQSVAVAQKRLDLALLLAVLACRQESTVEARSALLASITVSPFLVSIMRGAHERVPAAALSSDGTLIAHTTPTREIIVWSVETRRPLFTRSLEQQPHALAFMPEGSGLAVGTEDGTVELHGTELHEQSSIRMVKEADAVTALAFRPDGEQLAVGTRRGVVALWELASKSRRPLATVHGDAITGLAFADGGDRLASASKDRKLYVWNLADPAAAPALLSPANVSVGTEDPLRVTFDRREGRFISAEDRAVLLGGPAPAAEAESRKYPAMMTSVSTSPNGETLAFGDSKGNVGLWDLTTGALFGRTLDLHTACVNDVAFHPDGHRIVSASDDGAVALWSLSPPDPYAYLLQGHYDLVYSSAFSPDGTRLISAGKTSIVVWDVATRQQIGGPILELGNSTATLVAIAPSGSVFAASHIGSAVALYDAHSFDRLGILAMKPGPEPDVVHRATVTGIAFTADEQMLISIARDGTLAVWAWSAAGDPEVRVRADLPELYTLAVHPHARVAAVAGKGGAGVYLVDLDTLQTSEPLPMVGTIFRIAFSPDGKLLAAGTDRGVVQLWSWREQQPFGEPMVAHADRIYAAEFHPDGKTLATGGPDGAILLWDVETQQPYTQRLSAHTGFVYGIAFSPDGRMASCSDDRNVILWDMNPESWQARAKAIANRNLTPVEWRRYMTDEPYTKLFEELP